MDTYDGENMNMVIPAEL
jgi:hypothetical protein